MSELKSELKRTNKTAHFGIVFSICHKKHAEKAPEFWEYKGRVVFQGNQVKTESNQMALFSDQGTGANHHTSGKLLDMLGRLPGCHGQDSDAVSACTQAPMQGVDTWVTLPREQWPKGAGWGKY